MNLDDLVEARHLKFRAMGIFESSEVGVSR
jgi:hypothetical protein